MVTDQDYEKYARLITYTVNRFFRLYGGDHEEMKCIANLAFVEAMEDHRKGNNLTVSTFITRQIRWRLIDHFRGANRNLRREKETTHQHLETGDDRTNDKSHWLVDMLDSVSDDARMVINLVIECPEDLKRLYHHSMGGWSKAPRAALRTFLRANGWSVPRIYKAFKEIKGAISA